ncbi:MAG: sugar kinase [Deltaproteobacteria bacterium]|nr:sugar kinase [Candidatus Zymogenaceae bacterium]
MKKLDVSSAAQKPVAAFGEIMLRLAAPNFERFFQSPVLSATFGGGEANVLSSLALLGMRARFLSVLPDNDIGRGAIRVLRGLGVDMDHVTITPGSRMGIYFLERGANQRPSKVIYDRTGSAIAEVAPGMIDWEAVLSGCGWFHVTGITPALSEGAARETKTALATARKLGLIVSMDLNYRSKLWKWGKSAPEVMGELVRYVDVVVANEEDCQKSLGVGTDIDPTGGEIDAAHYEKLSKKMFAAYPDIKILAITLRESISASANRWGALISDGSEVHFSRKYDITHIVDRVGGGDSFAAGLIYGLCHLDGPKEALEFAVAASCLAHSVEGDMNLSTLDEVINLYSGDATGRIKR